MNTRTKWVGSAGALFIVLAGVIAWQLAASPAPAVPLPSAAPSAPPQPDNAHPAFFYLHGTGSANNPATLFLDTTAPTATSPKFKDSAGVNFKNGNPWKEIGTWTTAAPEAVATLGDLRMWLGLKNSDDQGTQFDLRAEAYKNAALISSGETHCITGITRNQNKAKEVFLQFAAMANGTAQGDTLALKVLTRIGTNPDGTKCPGPGGSHANAVGLRLYFDAVSRPSFLEYTSQPSPQPEITWTPSSVEVILSPGESLIQSTTFTSSLAFNNATFATSPELVPFLTVSPAAIANVPAGTPQAVTLDFAIASDAPFGDYDGTLHVEIANHILSQTLNVVVRVWNRFSSAPSLGVSFVHPPSWNTQQRETPLADDPISVLVAAQSPSGSEFLILPDGESGYELHEELQETVSSVTVSGYPAQRREFRLPNGALVLVRFELIGVRAYPHYLVEFEIHDPTDLSTLEFVANSLILSPA